MEQRRLRLGDILDDYCPRERRLTNHAVVAMIEEDVKQTRCTTCDAEHAYKGGKVPRRRKKETTAALYKEVLAGHLAADGTPIDPELDSASAEPPVTPADVPVPVAVSVAPSVEDTPAQTADEEGVDDREDVAEGGRPDVSSDASGDAPVELEEGPVHRPLIRAQLPRIEGQKEERRLPEFTIRQRSGNGHFRGGDTRMKPHRPGGHGGNGGSGSGGTGNRPHGAPRFAGPRPAGGRGPAGRGGPAAGFRSGRKRSR
jgi:hypothetical protein